MDRIPDGRLKFQLKLTWLPFAIASGALFKNLSIRSHCKMRSAVGSLASMNGFFRGASVKIKQKLKQNRCARKNSL
jgi:hypothetical protein